MSILVKRRSCLLQQKKNSHRQHAYLDEDGAPSKDVSAKKTKFSKSKDVIDPDDEDEMNGHMKDVEKNADQVEKAVTSCHDNLKNNDEGNLPCNKINDLNKFVKVTVFPVLKFLNKKILKTKPWILEECLKELGYTSVPDQALYRCDTERCL